MRIKETYKEKILKPSDLKPFLRKDENLNNKTHLIHALIRYQLTYWPLLADAYANLKSIKTKNIQIDKTAFEINFNPLRKINVTARVDRKTIESKKCPLCPQNLYEQQMGIILENVIAIPNPRPIDLKHLTLIGNHKPQHINSNVISQMFKLAHMIYPFRLLYNGPGVGASIPNHFHFQALPCELPIENPFLEREKIISGENCLNVYTLKFPSRVLVIEGNNSKDIEDVISKILAEIEKMDYIDSEWKEHMVNLWVSYLPKKKMHRFFVIPRSKHRPHDFGIGKDEVAISPAMIEIGGKIIVANEATFNKIDERLIRRIFSEVCIPEDDFKKLVRNLSR